MNEKEFEKLWRVWLHLIRQNTTLIRMVHQMHERVRELDKLKREVWTLAEAIDEEIECSSDFLDRLLPLHNILGPRHHSINDERWWECFKIENPTKDDFVRNLAKFAAMMERDAVERENYQKEQAARQKRLDKIGTEELEEELKRRRGS